VNVAIRKKITNENKHFGLLLSLANIVHVIKTHQIHLSLSHSHVGALSKLIMTSPAASLILKPVLSILQKATFVLP
jgi:hypothetical protein